jgi:hypothetical protein
MTIDTDNFIARRQNMSAHHAAGPVCVLGSHRVDDFAVML